MINSVNALELLKPKLITMDKFNTTTTTKLLPTSSLSQTRTFVTISGHHHHHPEKQQQLLFNDDIKHQERVRVQHLENHTKLQNNKCWNNFRTLYNNISASSATSSSGVKKDNDNEIDVVNVEHLSPTTQNNIQTKSAFNLEINNKICYNNNNNNNSICGNNNNNIKIKSTNIVGSNNNQLYCKQLNNNKYGLINKQSSPPTTTTMIVMTPTETQASLNNNNTQRTEDQNNAYRHIESVHNYAKSKSYEDDDEDNKSPNGSRHSSYLDDDEEDEEDDDEEDNNDDDIDAVYGNEDEMNIEEFPHDLDDAADYEDIFNRRRYKRLQKLSTSSDGAVTSKNNRLCNIRVGNSTNFVNVLKDQKIRDTVKKNDNKKNVDNDDEDVHIDVDVETVESQTSPNLPIVDRNTSSTIVNSIGEESAAADCAKPDHHARRPMNAFLIFCKRHRAIVKDRYKNLENRAITKILGDWWASLEANDKKCFTNLAQQNKDAFFSANPNFKWYKLPAPPLRTLTTRPANAFGQEYQEDNNEAALEVISNNTRSCNSSNNHGNYFKLADEAQMGDLSQLMQDKSKSNNTKKSADLQQALGETSQFMSAHITGNTEGLEDNPLKRRYHNENSFSSNSSEDDNLEPKKKSARSCKGKRYQELINSGQIATAVKKSKSSMRLSGCGVDNAEMVVKQNFANVSSCHSPLNNNNNIVCQKRSISETENILSYDLSGFDLEERIKELPALNLDDYLQRKRNTKKKKKFSTNGKKRGQRGNTNNEMKTTQAVAAAAAAANQIAKQQQIATAAVGSQKRKARKESITRRDVSAIEEEVTSLLPLTINGCCYFQEAPTTMKYIKEMEKDNTTAQQSLNVSTSPIIPLQQFNNNNNSSSSVSVDIFNNINTSNNNNTLNDNISSSTSDLLILAEVAANRTELKH
ncbi:putative uncharacterized protein DDB_G0286901 [Lucilia cuprina]|uniref:putative uncharacterized protein DDB_G0286901 n=1 Tax=Lucilia cuprina TaxID=7375 RepID=UPI001F067BC6|nr:putative uncharacterized protein DDB_G0286901 [Lucilia cuprina]